MAGEPPYALEYASPTTPRRRFLLRSQRIAFVTGAFAVFAAMFVPDTVGSGDVRVNPLAAMACFAIMGGAIMYIWTRLSEETGQFSVALGFVGICCTIAIIALPFQFWALADSYGEPYVWLRLELFSPTLFRPALYWPSLIVITAVLLAAIGRAITKHPTGSARRRGVEASNADPHEVG